MIDLERSSFHNVHVIRQRQQALRSLSVTHVSPTCHLVADDSAHSADGAHSHSVVTNIAEKLLSARHYPRYKRDSSESTDQGPVLEGLHCNKGKQGFPAAKNPSVMIEMQEPQL